MTFDQTLRLCGTITCEDGEERDVEWDVEVHVDGVFRRATWDDPSEAPEVTVERVYRIDGGRRVLVSNDEVQFADVCDALDLKPPRRWEAA
jgi:hypothetical protein